MLPNGEVRGEVHGAVSLQVLLREVWVAGSPLHDILGVDVVLARESLDFGKIDRVGSATGVRHVPMMPGFERRTRLRGRANFAQNAVAAGRAYSRWRSDSAANRLRSASARTNSAWTFDGRLLSIARMAGATRRSAIAKPSTAIEGGESGTS